MTNIKITDLTAYTNPATTDVLPIVDVGADVTKKVSVGEIVSKITGDVEVDSVGASSIAAGAIVNADVNASAAIAGTKISPDFGSQNVTTTGTATAAALIPSGSSVPTNGVYLPSANNVAISTNGTGRLFIDANGNVGVGVTSSQSLHVKSTSNGTTARFENNAGNFIDFYESSGGTRLGYIGSLDNVNWTFHNDKAGAISFDTNNTERLRITSDGKLGVGSSAPNSAFDVNGVITVRNNGNIRGLIGAVAGDDNYIGLQNGALADSFANSAINQNTTGSTTVNAAAGQQLSLRIGNGDAIRIDSSKRVGIGTSSPSVALHVATTGTPQFRLEDLDTANAYSNVSASNGNFTIQADPQNVSGSTRIGFEIDGSERARIDSSGRLLVGTSSAISGGVNNNGSATTDSNQFLQVANSEWDKASASFSTYQTDGAPNVFAQIGFNRANSGTVGSIGTALVSNAALGGVVFSGSDGTKFVPAAYITAFTDGSTGVNDMPGRLVFSTTADGAASPTERLRITNNGELRLRDSLGSGGVAVRNYASTSPPVGILSYYETTVGTAQRCFDIVAGDPGVWGSFIRFSTADGSTGSTTERMRIDSAGTTTLTSAAATAPFIAKISTTEAARIDSSGRLLVGTSTGSEKLRVAGQVQIGNGTVGSDSNPSPGGGFYRTTGYTAAGSSHTISDFGPNGDNAVNCFSGMVVVTAKRNGAAGSAVSVLAVTKRDAGALSVTEISNKKDNITTFTVTNTGNSLSVTTDSDCIVCTSFVGGH